MNPPAVALVGTTASGKSAVAAAVCATRPDIEIVSVDSMCVYRSMDAGTAKPSVDARRATAHHMLDMVDPTQEYTVAEYQKDALAALADIRVRGRRALLVGGTGLYLRALVDGLKFPGRYPEVAAALELEADTPEGLETLFSELVAVDPLAASRIEPSNRRRLLRALEVIRGTGVPFSSFGPGLETYPDIPTMLIGIAFDPVTVDLRIEERLSSWMTEGLVGEVAALAQRPGGLSRTARQALGYREILLHLEDDTPLEDCLALAVQRTRTYARRQWHWFRRDPRILWVEPDQDPVSVLGDALDAVQDGVAAPRVPDGARL